jgi:hypothetical protein
MVGHEIVEIIHSFRHYQQRDRRGPVSVLCFFLIMVVVRGSRRGLRVGCAGSCHSRADFYGT